MAISFSGVLAAKATSITIQYVNVHGAPAPPCQKDSRILPNGTVLTMNAIKSMANSVGEGHLEIARREKSGVTEMISFNTNHLFLDGPKNILLYKHSGGIFGNVANLQGVSLWAIDNFNVPATKKEHDFFAGGHAGILIECQANQGLTLRNVQPSRNYTLQLRKLGESRTGSSLYRGVLV